MVFLQNKTALAGVENTLFAPRKLARAVSHYLFCFPRYSSPAPSSSLSLFKNLKKPDYALAHFTHTYTYHKAT
jgi:hypothetical protein